ncbi:MAG: ATP-binding cassette domain-containing protein [Gaiellales bacterium]
MSEPAFRLREVSIWRWDEERGARVPIVDAVDWTISAGETWALLGPNGAGKTTLLTVLGAVEFPSSGEVEILGERPGHTDMAALRERIGFVDARLATRFDPELTVAEVVSTGVTGTVWWFPGRIDAAGRERARTLLRTFSLERIAERRFRRCSHGERTRTLIARALVRRPPLLLLDEPGSGLDLPGRETLLAALTTLARDEPELATVITTHHLEELPETTSHALLLRRGAVIAAGPATEVLTDRPLSACFELAIRATHEPSGRWHALGDFL